MNYISNTKEQKNEMLKAIGVSKITELFQGIPQSLILNESLRLPDAMSEMEVRQLLEGIAAKNKANMQCFLGAGAYIHFIPAIVNHLLSRGEFITSYTPYQPEISQGMLQAIFEYQTMICNLTGMDVANASMYDNSSALAEAAIMACRIKKKNKVVLSGAVHPEHRDVVKTYAYANSIEVIEADCKDGTTVLAKNEFGKDFAAVLVQQPNFFGCIENLSEAAAFAHSNDALLVASINEPTSLGILKSPGSCGADIVVGEGHSFGNSISFGGPFVGFMTTREEFVRQLPGRLVGETVDREGKRGFILTLQAREQHIRREKATSNICTNEALNALAVTITLAAFGKGLKDLAVQNLQKAHYALDKMGNAGIKRVFAAPFYNEFAVRLSDFGKAKEKLIESNIIPGLDISRFYPEMENTMLICITEMHSKKQIDNLVSLLSGN